MPRSKPQHPRTRSLIGEFIRRWDRCRSPLALEVRGAPRQLMRYLLQGRGHCPESFTFQRLPSAPGAVEVTFAMQPTQVFLDLLRALRAADKKRQRVAGGRHGGNSIRPDAHA